MILHANGIFLCIWKELQQKKNVQYEQNGRLSAIGIAYCVRFSRQFSFGFTFNIWDNDIENEWKERTFEKFYDSANVIGEAERIERYLLNAYNFNIGFLWIINNKLTTGGVIKTPFKADLEYEKILSLYDISGKPYIDGRTMNMPLSYGIGIAYRFSDDFTASLDIYRTEWDDFVVTTAEGVELSPLTDRPVSESDIDPTHQVRMGAEYLYKTSKYVIPIRGGMFYDPAPAEGSPDNFFGFSFGLGFVKMKKKVDNVASVDRDSSNSPFQFDIAYQFRFGFNVGEYLMKSWNTSQNIEEHAVYASVIFRF